MNRLHPLFFILSIITSKNAGIEAARGVPGVLAPVLEAASSVVPAVVSSFQVTEFQNTEGGPSATP